MFCSDSATSDLKSVAEEHDGPWSPLCRAAGTSSHPTDGLGIHVEIFISPLTIPTFYKQLTILKIIWETGSVGPTVHKSRLFSSLLEKSQELC